MKLCATIILSLVVLAFCLASSCPENAVAGTDGQKDAAVTETSRNPIVHHLETGIAEAAGLLARYGYIILFLAILVEGFGIPAPGQTLLMAASIEAARGQLEMVWVFALALLAAAGGNTVGYAIGRWGGHPLMRRLGVQENRFARVEKHFAASGAGVLLVARFFDGLRQLNGIVAGLLEMPWRKFVLWSTLGAVLWTSVWGLGIYFLGKRMHPVHLTFKRIEPLVVVLSFAGLVSLIVYLLRRRNNRR
jgi:membrane protein DedA with SNARE-associated domain